MTNSNLKVDRTSYPGTFVGGSRDRLAEEYGSDPQRSHYAGMLVDDLRTSVGLYSLQTRARDHVRIEPDSDANRRYVSDSIGKQRAAAAIQQLLRTSASAMALTGKAIFEVALLREPEGNNTKGIRLFPLSYSTTLVPFFGAIQHLSGQAAETQGSNWVWISRSNLLVIHLPDHLRSGWRSMMQTLVEFSNPLMPDFALPSSPEEQSDRVPFDLEEFQLSSKIAIARATRDIGWNGRSTFSDEQNSFLATLRYLRWIRTRIEVRDAILDALNQVYDRFVNITGVQVRVELENVIIKEEVESAQNDLLSGNTPLEAIYDRFRSKP